MEPTELKDEIRISTSSVDLTTTTTNELLAYLITGNPGLVEYYRHFLTSLSQNFEDAKNPIRYHVVGRSLSGFELNGFSNEDSLPLSLQEEIVHVEQSVQHVATTIQRTNISSTRPLPVILIGHSVGTYMILELIERRQKQQRLATAPSDYKIVGAINLFPTIIDIAKSPTGKKASPFATSVYLAPTLHLLSKTLAALTPSWILRSLVQRLTGQNESAAAVTTAFLQSKYGVLQALHMARFELLQMTHDKWANDVWERPRVEAVEGLNDEIRVDRPRLYFYWGDNDHWIDNLTRDSVISKRAKRNGDVEDDGKPWMEIDTRGTGHDFCINAESSEFMAGKVAGYIKEVVDLLQKGEK